MIEVKVLEANGKQRIIPCDKESVMIGRAIANDICLDITGVSRYHARLAIENGRVIVQDLGSTNGTFVNSKPVEQVEISPVDKIMIGSVILTAVLKGSNAAAGREPGSKDIPAADTSGTLVGQKSEALVKAVNQAVKSAPPTKPVPAVQSGTPGSATLAATPAGQSPGGPAVGSTGNGKPAAVTSPAPEAVETKAAPKPGVETTKAKGASAEEQFYWKSLESFLAPIWKFQIDDAVSEILINGPEEIYIERKGRLEEAGVRFTADQLNAAVLNIAQYVGRRVSEDEPYLDARLPDGSRVAVLLPPCSRKGISVSIRKFAKEKLTLDRLIDFGSLSKEMVDFLRAAVILKKNIIVSGGTSSGKTSLLNVVSGLIPADERILTIEDAAELQLSQDHVLPMETKPPDKKGRGQVTIRDLVRASLRMRPDRIVVGEIRSGEALDLLQAMNTGHSGSMATVHASSPAQALTRLETLALFSGIEIPMRALREQVSTAIEVVIQATRLPDHSRKVTHITEVGHLTEQGAYQVHDVFRFQNEGRTPDGKIKGRHNWTGYMPKILSEMELAGLTDAVALFKGGMTAVKPAGEGTH